jgi:hypothetical protein
MSMVRAVVYDPPRADFPFLAVLFYEADVLATQPFSTAEEAELFIDKASVRLAQAPNSKAAWVDYFSR